MRGVSKSNHHSCLSTLLLPSLRLAAIGVLTFGARCPLGPLLGRLPVSGGAARSGRSVLLTTRGLALAEQRPFKHASTPCWTLGLRLHVTLGLATVAYPCQPPLLTAVDVDVSARLAPSTAPFVYSVVDMGARQRRCLLGWHITMWLARDPLWWLRHDCGHKLVDEAPTITPLVSWPRSCC